MSLQDITDSFEAFEPIMEEASRRVIEWNDEIFKADATTDNINNQNERIREELINELGHAETVLDLVDAVCDSFVVLTMQIQMLRETQKEPKGALSFKDVDGHVSALESYRYLTDPGIQDDLEENLFSTSLFGMANLMNLIKNYEGADCVGALFEVINNNRTKIVHNRMDEVVYGARKIHADRDPESTFTVQSTKSCKGLWVRREHDHKIMKPYPLYEEVELGKFVY